MCIYIYISIDIRTSGKIRVTKIQEESPSMYILYCTHLILPLESEITPLLLLLLSARMRQALASLTENITTSVRLLQCATSRLTRAIWLRVQGRRLGRSSHRPWKVLGSAGTYFSRTLVSVLRYRCTAL